MGYRLFSGPRIIDQKRATALLILIVLVVVLVLEAVKRYVVKLRNQNAHK
jgi:hypothetical protein